MEVPKVDNGQTVLFAQKPFTSSNHTTVPFALLLHNMASEHLLKPLPVAM